MVITYNSGIGASSANTSARISRLTDTVSAVNGTYCAFTYNSDPIPHLVAAYTNSGTYNMAYAPQALTSPFSGDPPYGSVTMLENVTAFGLNIGHSFQYAATGEMTSVTTPLGGTLGWQYTTFQYSSGVSLREVQARTMNAGFGATTNSWTFSHESGSSSPYYHAYTDIHDVGANTDKVYWPAGTGFAPVILPSAYEEWNASGTINVHKDYSWAGDSNGNPYLSSVKTTLNPGTSAAIQTMTAQSRDSYGNMLSQQIYDYGNLSTPARSYTFSYVTDTNYTSRYLRNLLSSATETWGTNGSATLVSKAYDNSSVGSLQDVPGAPLHDSNYSSSYTYRGNATTVTNLGVTTYYAYQTSGVPYLAQDLSGRRLSLSNSIATGYSLPDTLTPNNNSNLATSLSYSSSFAVTSVTGPNNANSTVTYDGYNRPTSSKSVDGAVTNYTYSYNPNIQTATISNTTNGNTTTQWTKTTLDGFGRVISVVTGNNSNNVSEVDTQYAPCACSPLGKMWRVSEPYVPGGQPVWTTYTYDGSGRTLTITKPDGSTTHYSYSGNNTTVTDPAGKWKTNTTDAMGNLVTVTEPDPAYPATSTFTTTYTYDGLNNLLTVSMPRYGTQQTRTFTWSGSHLMSATNPENGTVTYAYNGSGQVTSRTDAKGQQTQYTYDGYGRLTLVQHYAGGQEINAQDVNYYYDTNPLNAGFSQNAWGRLAAVTFNANSQAFDYQYSYNSAGRVIDQRTEFAIFHSPTYPVEDLDVTYQWDNQGRMTQMTYPTAVAGFPVTGPTYNYQYDDMSNLSTIRNTTCNNWDGGGNCIGYQTVASASYNLAGQWTSLSYLGISAGRSFNNMLQLTGEWASGSGALMNMQYNYTAGQNNGRITSSVDSVFNETVNYSYDSLNRLWSGEEASNKWGNSFSYDGWGNVAGMTWTPGQVLQPSTSGSHSSNQPGTVDANGNLSSVPGVYSGTLTWDVENRLAQEGPYNGTYYGYDPWNKRVLQGQAAFQNETGSYTEIYLYSITGQRLGTYQLQSDQTGNFDSITAQLNLYFGGKLIESKGVAVATDRLGSVRGNANGETFAYYSYGKERTSTASGREKFGTYYQDYVDQNYADQRYYNSYYGTFYSPDPTYLNIDLENSQSWNMYLYVGADPVNANDPTGQYQWYCDVHPADPRCGGAPSPGGGGGSGGSRGPGGNSPADPPQARIPIPRTAPPCAQNQFLAQQALDNIVSGVDQVLASAGLAQSTINTIDSDLTNNESTPGDVTFEGGHFNLVLTSVQVISLGSAQAAVVGLFVSGTDGSASGVLGLFANGPRHDLATGTSLHSQQTSSGGIDFHLDLANPYDDVAGMFGHLWRDIRPRSKCLDAPFTATGVLP